MTLDQLRIFVAVAERENMTRAAQALNLVPSAVSHAVASLEAEFALKLFDRIGRGIVLTRAGSVLLDQARAVLTRAAAARARMAELARPGHGTLFVHASQTIAGYWLPARLALLRARYPALEIAVSIGNTGAVARSIADGVAELGFVEGDIDDPDLETITVAQDQLVIVVAPDHPWAALARLTPEKIVEGNWILRETGSGTRSAFAQALAFAGIAPDGLAITLELPSNEAVRAAVEAGLGASALSASVAASGLEAGLLHQVPFTLPPRRFDLVRHRARALSASATAFQDLVVSG